MQFNKQYAWRRHSIYNFDLQMKRAHSSQQLSTLSLVKSREMLDRITSKVGTIQPSRHNGALINSIQTSSKKIQHTLDTKIEDNFHQLMHSPTLMPLSRTQNEKENLMNASATALDGAKALMHHYWERNKKQPAENSHKDVASKTFQSRKSEKLPEIHSYPKDHKLAAYIRNKEKEKELGIGGRQEEVEQDFHISIPINHYKCQNDSKDFLRFQKRYYKRWDEIHSILRALEKFAEHYCLAAITIQTVRVFQVIERVQQGERITPHHLLFCCDNAEAISQQNQNQAGIRFFGISGMARATTLIQAHFRGHAQRRKYKATLREWRSAKLIQAQFRCFMLHQRLKQQILKRQLDKLANFKQLQQTFRENYRKREVGTRKRIEIHIPSHNLSEWQKLSAEHFLQQQNGELCRIFRIAQRNPLVETHVIYVSPVNLPKELLGYYRKLLELGAEEPIDHRLTILTPDYDCTLPVNMPLTQQLYYSSRTLRKLRRLVHGTYTYIVPSTPSNDYIHLCTELKVPLYAGDPQKLLYLQTRAGCKGLQEALGTQEGDGGQGCGVLPYSVDVYTQANLLNELTNLIYRYPFVKRWVLKIDNEATSRGVAYIDISKVVGRQFLQRVGEESGKVHQQKQHREEIYAILQNALVVNGEERIIPIDRQAYPTQTDFLKYFYTRGGIIQASINNFQGQLQNSCFTVNVQPDGEWKFVCSYYKITNKNKGVAAYFDGNCIKPPLQINALVQSLKCRQLFGYFTFEFLTICQQEKTMKRLENRLSYLNSVDCHLSALSSAHFLKEFISRESNALFVPMVAHPCLRELRLQTFFHLCRLQNISFDMEKKVGNVFMFLNGLESGCLGIMTFNAQSRQHCYTHTAEVLDFLNSKLKHTSQREVPPTFLSLKNAVNGHLNRLRKQKNTRSQKILNESSF